MTLPVFWVPGFEAGELASVRLDGAEAQHAAVVRRIAVGERVRVTDGRGTYVEGAVLATDRRCVEVAVAARGTVPAPDLRLTVVQAVPKRERAELAVQGLAEVGVDRVVPWAAERSQVRTSGERGERLVTKWRGWAHEASKQARRSWFCEVAEVAGTAEVARLVAAADLGVVLHESAAHRLTGLPVPPHGELVLVVGPEGGIGEDELDRLGGSAVAARLGDTVLRTSTAGPVAAGIVLAGGRWR